MSAPAALADSQPPSALPIESERPPAPQADSGADAALTVAQETAHADSTLAQGEVHLHLYPLATLEQQLDHDAALAWLAPAEQQVLATLRTPARRREWLYGRAMLRHWLAHYAQVAATNIEICLGAHGKPFARLCPPAHDISHGAAPFAPAAPTLPVFNLAHNDTLLVLAFARQGALGVDVESHVCDWQHEFAAIAAARFAPAEQALLQQLETTSKSTRAAAFFRIWTLKEAALKAAGLGLSPALRQIDVARQVPEYALTLTGADGTLALTGWHWSLPHWQAELALMQHGAGSVVRWFEHA